MTVPRIRLGIEELIEGRPHLIRGARVGAVVHPASIVPSLSHSADVLARRCRLAALFGPQHGARGEKQDNMVESGHYRDPDLGIPVHSLYSETRRPTDSMLQDVDVLVYDLQDVGTRVYTFIWTLVYCMEACARTGKRLLVADRPNPIGGVQIEGNTLEPGFESFVGLRSIPMRHGMTAGELALMFNAESDAACDLTVVPMAGWRRSQWFDQTGLPWVQPSPNLPTPDSTVVYPGMVLVEGTNLSEGRGTTRPFEYVGAPYLQARSYAQHLNGLALPGVFFREAYFQPTFQKWAGSMCGGAQIHVTDRSALEPYLTGIAVIAAARMLAPEHFQWRQPPYEYENEKLPIEILCGTRMIPAQIDSGTPLAEIRAGWQDDVAFFADRRRPYLLY